MSVLAKAFKGHHFHSAVLPRAGAVVLPLGAGFPGMPAASKTATCGPLGKASVFFATAGERGVIKIWSAETGCCVYQRRCRQLQVPCGNTCILPSRSSQVQQNLHQAKAGKAKLRSNAVLLLLRSL